MYPLQNLGTHLVPPGQMLYSSSHLEGTSHLPAERPQGLSPCMGWHRCLALVAGPQRDPQRMCILKSSPHRPLPGLSFPRDSGEPNRGCQTPESWAEGTWSTELHITWMRRRPGGTVCGQEGILDYQDLHSVDPFRAGPLSVLFAVLPPHIEQCQVHIGSLTDSWPMEVGC